MQENELPAYQDGSKEEDNYYSYASKIFLSYASRDKILKDRLEEHLMNLKYRGLISTWSNSNIQAGEIETQQIDVHLKNAHIVLLLISSHFMASNQCYRVEMKQAFEVQKQRKTDIISILLRPTLYTDEPFAKLRILPTNKKPVVLWRNRDLAFTDIALGIEDVALEHRQAFLSTEGELGELFDFLDKITRIILVTPIVFCIAIVAFSWYFIHFNMLLLIIVTLSLSVIAIFLVFPLFRSLFQSSYLFVRYKRQRARKRYYKQSVQSYQMALGANPGDRDALQGMGNALLALKRYDEALSAYQRVIQHCLQTHIANVEDKLQQPRKKEGNKAMAYAGLGNTLAKQRCYSEAVTAYEQALTLDPTVTFNFEDFIQALRTTGRKEKIISAIEKAKQLGYEHEERERFF